MDLKKLCTRTLSGIIYIAIIVGCILGGESTVMGLACLFSLLAVIEFSKICSEFSKERIPTIILDVAGCICLSLAGYWPFYGFPILLWIIVILARMVEELYLNTGNPLKGIAQSLMTQIYIGIPMGCMVAISSFFDKPTILLAVFIFIWLNDTGAFLVGSLLGRHRLFERISPKKSWEGFFGGLGFTIGSAFLFRYCFSSFFGLGTDTYLWIGLAIVVTVFATWGDLFESMLKRNLKIKDSGNLIPGHGGILDRIDSLLFVAPAVFLYLLSFSFLGV